MAQNVVHHGPPVKARGEIGGYLREVFDAKDLPAAEHALKDAVGHFAGPAPKLTSWLETNIPEGLAVFKLSKNQRKKLRTSNGTERPIQQELKRQTVKIPVLPNVESLLRLVTVILVEIDDE